MNMLLGYADVLRGVFCEPRKGTIQIFASSVFFLKIGLHLKPMGNEMSNALDV